MATSTANDRMKEYRDRLRRQGLRPVQIWVPDQRSPRFLKELKRQVANLDRKDEVETLAFLERVADWPER